MSSLPKHDLPGKGPRAEPSLRLTTPDHAPSHAPDHAPGPAGDPPVDGAGDLTGRMKRIEAMIAEIESGPDPQTRGAAQRLVSVLLDLHGEALAQLIKQMDGDVLDGCAGDELISSVLLLHGVHPWTLRERVEHALDRIRCALEPRGGAITLLHADELRVRVRVRPGHGCGSMSMQLREMIENALIDSAPEIAEVQIDGLERTGGLVSVTIEARRPHRPTTQPADTKPADAEPADQGDDA